MNMLSWIISPKRLSTLSTIFMAASTATRRSAGLLTMSNCGFFATMASCQSFICAVDRTGLEHRDVLVEDRRGQGLQRAPGLPQREQDLLAHGSAGSLVCRGIIRAASSFHACWSSDCRVLGENLLMNEPRSWNL